MKANAMDELFSRQAGVLRRLIADYRGGELNLNALIQRIEGVGGALGSEAWNEAVFPVVLSMEQVNASAMDEKRRLTKGEGASIERSLAELEALIARFEIM